MYFSFHILRLLSMVICLCWKTLKPIPIWSVSSFPLCVTHSLCLWELMLFSYIVLWLLHPTACESNQAEASRHSNCLIPDSLSLSLQLQVTIFKVKGQPHPHPFGTNVHQPSNLCLREMTAVWAAIPSLQMVHILYLVWEVKFRKAISLKAKSSNNPTSSIGLWWVGSNGFMGNARWLSFPGRGLFLSI